MIVEIMATEKHSNKIKTWKQIISKRKIERKIGKVNIFHVSFICKYCVGSYVDLISYFQVLQRHNTLTY